MDVKKSLFKIQVYPATEVIHTPTTQICKKKKKKKGNEKLKIHNPKRKVRVVILHINNVIDLIFLLLSFHLELNCVFHVGLCREQTLRKRQWQRLL